MPKGDFTFRRGKVSHEEQDFILTNAGKMAVTEIARRVRRKVEFVKKFIQDNKGKKFLAFSPELQKTEEKEEIRQELRDSQEWQRLKDEFDHEERKLFEEKFIALMSQFRGDVLKTEQTQIMMAIKFEILLSRNLIARQRIIRDIATLEQMQTNFLKGFNNDPSKMSDGEKQYSVDLHNQLEQLRSSEQNKTIEYVKLADNHSDLLKSLKSTREQRIKQIETGKISMLGLIKSLQERDIQARESRPSELMRIATEKEYERLGELHQYSDGNWDRPILSADTVDKEA